MKKTFKQRGGFEFINDEPRTCKEIHAQIKSFMEARNYPEGMQCGSCKKVFNIKPKRLENPKGKKKMAAKKKARTAKQKANDKKLGLAAKRRAAAKRKTNPVKKKTKAQLAALAKKKKAATAKKKKAATKKKATAKKKPAAKKKATAKKKAPEKKTKVYKKNVPAKRGSIIVGLSDLRADKTYKDFMYYTAVGAIKNAWNKSIQEAAMWTTHAKAQKASKALIKNYPQNTAFFVVTQNASKANVEEIITRYGYERRGARKK